MTQLLFCTYISKLLHCEKNVKGQKAPEARSRRAKRLKRLKRLKPTKTIKTYKTQCYTDNMLFAFENLEVYQLSIKLVKEIYKITEKLPRKEEYVLKPQLLRATISIALNIAEGAGRHQRKDFARFIRIAIGSLQEVQAILRILLDLEEIKEPDVDKVRPLMEKLYFKLIALEKSLR